MPSFLPFPPNPACPSPSILQNCVHGLLVLGLGGGRLEVRNQVLAVALGLDAGKYHLGALDVVLGRQQVFEEGVLPPDDARVLVGRGVGVVLRLARLAAKQAVEVGALLVRAALLMVVVGWGVGWGEPRVWWWRRS